jgi:DNA adenine methylase
MVEFLPRNLKKIVSPFFGGGSFEIACAKELGFEVVGYDIFDILVNYWQVQIKHPKALYGELQTLCPNREVYRDIKLYLLKHWAGELKLPSLELAVAYYFNHNLSYGPSFLGWMSSIYLNEKRYLGILERVKNFHCDNLSVSCKSFEDSIQIHTGDFLYCDPPYFLGGGSKVFRGIYPQRNNPIHHNNFNHLLLRDLLMKHNGGFLLSYNDCPEVREFYKNFRIVEVQWQYTMGQGETRIGKNRKNRELGHVKNSHELLIMNY